MGSAPPSLAGHNGGLTETCLRPLKWINTVSILNGNDNVAMPTALVRSRCCLAPTHCRTRQRECQLMRGADLHSRKLVEAADAPELFS